MTLCDRVYVFRNGRIAAELAGRGDHRGADAAASFDLGEAAA
jgi:ABC-type sugar transport system ATPase subunit